MEQVQDMGDAIFLSITDALRAFFSFLPQLVGAILVLIIGWIIAGFAARLVETALRTVGFEKAAERSGIAGFMTRSGASPEWTASKVVAELVKWFIRLIFLQAAAAILGMPQLTGIINSILLFLPNLVVALLIIVVGALIAKLVGGIVRGSTAQMGFANPDLLGTIGEVAVIAFAVVAAVNQVGIAATVVNTLFMAFVGAIALAFALAFGLGGRDTAALITHGWYRRGQEATAKVAAHLESQQAATASAAPAAAAPGELPPPPRPGETPAG